MIAETKKKLREQRLERIHNNAAVRHEKNEKLRMERILRRTDAKILESSAPDGPEVFEKKKPKLTNS